MVIMQAKLPKLLTICCVQVPDEGNLGKGIGGNPSTGLHCMDSLCAHCLTSNHAPDRIFEII